MGDPAEELRILRAEVETLARMLDAVPEPDGDGAGSLAVQTISGGSYPTTGAAGKVFKVQALDISGVSSEGAGATATVRGSGFYAANLLAGVPPSGTKLVVHLVPGGGWVFQYA